MRDRDLGEPRQLREMPRRRLEKLDKLANSVKRGDRERAIKKLDKIGPYVEVPRLTERALVPPISADVIVTGVAMLGRYVQEFSVRTDWGFNAFMKFFDYKEWTERTMWDWGESFIPWLGQVASKLNKEQREQAAMYLVAALRMGPIEFRGPWYANKSLAVADGIGLASSEFSEEVVPIILPMVEVISPERDMDDFAAFWMLTKVLCEIKDPRSIDFLKERLADAPDASEAPGGIMATKQDVRRALVAMGEEI